MSWCPVNWSQIIQVGWVCGLCAIGHFVAGVYWANARAERRRILLDAVRMLEPHASTLAIGDLVAGKVSRRWVNGELWSMAHEGFLDRWSKVDGPSRGGKEDRVYYAVKRARIYLTNPSI